MRHCATLPGRRAAAGVARAGRARAAAPRARTGRVQRGVKVRAQQQAGRARAGRGHQREHDVVQLGVRVGEVSVEEVHVHRARHGLQLHLQGRV